MRIVEDRASGGRELLATVGVLADIEPLATVGLFLRASLRTALGCAAWALILYDVLIAARRAAHDAVRPAHFFDVLQALLIGAKLFVRFADIHATIMPE